MDDLLSIFGEVGEVSEENQSSSTKPNGGVLLERGSVHQLTDRLTLELTFPSAHISRI